MTNARNWILALVLVGVGALVIISLPNMATEYPPDEEAKDTSETVDATASSTLHEAAKPENTMQSNKPATSASTDEVKPSSEQLLFSYTNVMISKDYYIGWKSDSGSRATITFVKGDEVISTLADCTNMQVVKGVTQYCAWRPETPHVSQGMGGFVLKLTVYDAAGGVVGEVRSNTLALLSHAWLDLVPHKDTLFGWSVRHPESWYVKKGASQVVFAKDTQGLVNPHASNEAFLVEFCPIVYETCITRVENFRLTNGTTPSTLGGRRSDTHVVKQGTEYVKEDMLMRNGIAFFVSRRAADSAGTVISPFVRESIENFGYEETRTVVEKYSFDRSTRAGELLVKYVDSAITYVRLHTGGRTCGTEFESAVFLQTNSREFLLEKDSCTIEGTRVGNDTFIIEEDDCEDLHSGECAFEHEYELVE